MVRAAPILCGSLLALLALASSSTSSFAQDDTEELPESRIRTEGLFTIAPMFLSASEFDKANDRTWLEAWAFYHVEADVHESITLQFGVAGEGTLGEDPYGVEDDGALTIDAANVTLHDFIPGLAFVLGRQDFTAGDGFFIEDGVADEHGAAWNIPWRYWDGGRVDFIRGEWAATGLVFNLSDSFGPQDGLLTGAHATWCPNPEDTPLAHSLPQDDDMPDTYAGAGVFFRDDDGETDADANVATVRGSGAAGPVVFSGEFGKQFGAIGGVDLGGEGYRLGAKVPLSIATDAFVGASWFRFSGDDPETDEDETFFSWNYTSRDWSMYYLGEIAGATLLENSDLRVIKLETGYAPNESSLLRAYYLYMDTDRELEGVGGRHAADEFDIAFDWFPEDAPWEAYALLGLAFPGDVAEALAADDASVLLSLAITRKF